MSLLAMAACQPTSLQLNAPQSHCRSEPARDGGLTADQSPTDHTQSPVGAAEGCDLLTLAFQNQKPDQKIAAFGSSYIESGCV
ncbi:hypothetical protein EMIT0215P_20147 [Pseudomonas serboccidentalis]